MHQNYAMPWTLSAIYENVQLRYGMNEGGGGILGIEIMNWMGTLLTNLIPPPKIPNHRPPIIVDLILLHPMALLDRGVHHRTRSVRKNKVGMQVPMEVVEEVVVSRPCPTMNTARYVRLSDYWVGFIPGPRRRYWVMTRMTSKRRMLITLLLLPYQ